MPIHPPQDAERIWYLVCEHDIVYYHWYMTIYYICSIFMFVFAMLEVMGAKKIKIDGKTSINSVTYIYIAFLLSIIASFKFHTGSDWNSYLHIYNTAESAMKSGNASVEFGYILLNCIFSHFPHGFYWMRICIMIFCTKIIYSFFYKKSDFPIFTLYLYFLSYFFMLELGFTRQHIATAIIIFGNRFIERKQFFLWILIIAIAMQFHVTAIIAFPLYFTYRIKNLNPFFAFIILFFALLLNLFGLSLVWKMMYIILDMSFIPKRISRILYTYMNANWAGFQGQYSTGLGLILRYLFAFSVIVFYAIDFQHQKIVAKNQKEQGSYSQYILQKRSFQITNLLVAYIFQSMGRNFDVLGRLAPYYFICGGGIFAFNYIICTRFFTKHGIILRIFLLIFLIYFYYYSTSFRYFKLENFTYHFLLFHLDQL